MTPQNVNEAQQFNPKRLLPQRIFLFLLGYVIEQPDAALDTFRLQRKVPPEILFEWSDHDEGDAPSAALEAP